MKKVWALFKIKDVYKSNSSDMMACYENKPSADLLVKEGFSEWESRQLLKSNTVEHKTTSFYLEEIEDYEVNN